MKQNEQRNLSMVIDFYEMTMSNGYFLSGNKDVKVAFDVFYRKNPEKGGYSIFAGLEQIIEYIENLHFSTEDIEYLKTQGLNKKFLDYLKDFKFTGDIYAFPEGTIMQPNEPIMTVVAPVIEAQIIETAILLQVNHQSLIATKASRVVKAANGRMVSDFGARRAHNMDAAVYGSRACYIGGVNSSATVLAGQAFNMPISGTHAHSWVSFFGDEYTAFKTYAETYPDSSVFLVDTYDVIHSGVPNAIKVAKDVLEPNGHRLKGIRLDSGDLAYLSKKARQMLDEAGMEDCKIIVSNSLDEYTIKSLITQGAAIDSFGVGERMITAKSEPVFGAVYKLVAVEESGEFIPRIKISENVEKITNPGLKDVYRIYNSDGFAVADLITFKDEEVDLSNPYPFIDPKNPWKKRVFENCTAKKLQVPIYQNGKLVYNLPTLDEIRDYVKHQLDNEIWQETQRFEFPHEHFLDMSIKYYQNKMDMLHNAKEF